MALEKDKRPPFSTANLRAGISGSVSSPMLSSSCPCYWFSLHLSRSHAVQRLIVKDWGGSVCSQFLTAWSLLPLSMPITRLSESTPFLVNETSFHLEWLWLTNSLQQLSDPTVSFLGGPEHPCTFLGLLRCLWLALHNSHVHYRWQMACVPSPPASFVFQPFLVKSRNLAALQIVWRLALSPGSSSIFPSFFVVAAARFLHRRSLITHAVAATWCFTLTGLLILLEKVFRAISGIRKATAFDQVSFQKFLKREEKKYNAKHAVICSFISSVSSESPTAWWVSLVLQAFWLWEEAFRWQCTSAYWRLIIFLRAIH